MHGLRPVALLPLLALCCCADRGEEAAALMQQALFSAQASRAMAGGSVPPPAAERRPSGPAAASAPAAAVAPLSAIVPAMPPGPRQRGATPPESAAALLGSGTEQLRRMLGDPALRRPEGDAEVWLYEATNCRIDLVLYPQGGALVVAHAAARAHGASPDVTEAACLAAIATAPTTRPWGDSGRRA